jgi:hypothetical protein
MTRPNPLLGVVATLAIVLVGCSEQADPPTALQPDAPSVMMGHGPPASSGPIVVRYDDLATFLIIDPDTHVGAFFGADIMAICSGAASGFDRVWFRDIFVPAGEDRINELVKGDDVRASLWDPAPADCDEVLARGPTASGTGRFVSTDNDLLIFFRPDNRNANAFGVQGQAAVETATGEALGVNAISRCLWDGKDPATLGCKDKVMVH